METLVLYLVIGLVLSAPSVWSSSVVFKELSDINTLVVRRQSRSWLYVVGSPPEPSGKKKNKTQRLYLIGSQPEPPGKNNNKTLRCSVCQGTPEPEFSI
ncbi:hypothetical protein NDU88_002168 [Pleurodeles waltl]|uniref:Uncharacterized protein n=1 Tax=Pleurodeles waltl TaxID=8319 RepID=A0AAV7NHT5_PLEWA|nr:hypothetical protein NDU88_002168 [Pleurodeles waltl]